MKLLGLVHGLGYLREVLTLVEYQLRSIKIACFDEK